MPLPVVVDVAPPPEPPSLAATLIAACSDAVAGGSCLPEAESGDSVPVRARVSVRWLGHDEKRVRLRIVVPDAVEPRVMDRLISFQAADDRQERWRAVGFAAGALVGVEEARAGEQPGSTKPTTLPPKPVSPPRRSERPPAVHPERNPRHRPVWLGAGAAASPGLSGGTWRFGPWLRGEYDFAAVPLLIGLSGSFSASPSDSRGLKASWVGLGVGTGLYVDVLSIDLELRLRAELLAEWLRVAVQDEVSGLEDSGSRWTVGPRLSVHGCWPHDSIVAGVAGASAWTVLHETSIEVGGAEAAAAPWGALSLELGLRLAIP